MTPGAYYSLFSEDESIGALIYSRDMIKVMYPLILLLSTGTGFVFLVQGNIYDFISYMFVIPLLVSLPVLFEHFSHRPSHYRTHIDRLVFAIVALNIPGSLFLHEQFSQFQYDRFLHFSVGILLMPLAYYLLLFLCPSLTFSRSSLLGIFFILFIGLFLWEGNQFLRDKFFHSKTFYDYSQGIVQDFWEDIMFGSVGLVISTAVLVRQGILRKPSKRLSC